MTHSIFILATAVMLCTATAANSAEMDKRKPSQEIVVADAQDEIARAGRAQTVEELKATFRKRLSTISRWSQLR